MLRRIMNEQQLRTYLVTKDLRTEERYRELAVAIEVNSTNIQATFAHMTQQMIELDDDQNYNIKNRMDKQAYNNKVKADLENAM